MQATIGTASAGTIAASFGTSDVELAKRGTVHRWSARVGFSNGSRTILGQPAFLEHFTARFDRHGHRFELVPNGTFPAPAVTVP